jgi:hypothetical protein
LDRFLKGKDQKFELLLKQTDGLINQLMDEWID